MGGVVDKTKELSEEGQVAESSFSNFFDSIINGAKDGNRVVTDLIKSLVTGIAKARFLTPAINALSSGIGSFFGGGTPAPGSPASISSNMQNSFVPAVASANGNAFGAFGRILNMPTVSKAGRRLAVAAETRNEVQLPLARDSQGRLGVRSADGGGGGGGNVTMNVYTRDADSFRKGRRQLQQDMKRGMTS
jgi:phage-related minor tail protein